MQATTATIKRGKTVFKIIPCRGGKTFKLKSIIQGHESILCSAMGCKQFLPTCLGRRVARLKGPEINRYLYDRSM